MDAPKALKQIDRETLGISWADGHESVYHVRDLRIACRCALCVDELTGEQRLDPNKIPEKVHPQEIKPMGNYALLFHWSDGHSSGIYTFKHLRTLCQCSNCSA